MIIFLFIVIIFLIKIKNNKVIRFRLYVSSLCYEFNDRNRLNIINNKIDSAYKTYFYKLPSYFLMIYSFKSLNLKSYFNLIEIRNLLGEDNLETINIIE